MTLPSLRWFLSWAVISTMSCLSYLGVKRENIWGNHCWLFAYSHCLTRKSSFVTWYADSRDFSKNSIQSTGSDIEKECLLLHGYGLQKLKGHEKVYKLQLPTMLNSVMRCSITELLINIVNQHCDTHEFVKCTKGPFRGKVHITIWLFLLVQ